MYLGDAARQPLAACLVALILCPKKGNNQGGRKLGSHHPPAQAEHIHIVMHDTLGSRISIVANGGIHALQLVGSDTCPYPRAADQDAALRFPFWTARPTFSE